MKILCEPSSGKIGNRVAFISRYGQCQRELVAPKNTPSPARDHMRGAFGRLSRAWSGLLTEAQRDAWRESGAQVESAKRLGKSGPLTGQTHFQGINSARARIGLAMLSEPPAPVVFGPNPVGQLVITNDEQGVRLLLSLTGPVAEDIMVFGQAPCSSGRRKRRNVSYLGLLPAPQGGLSDITVLYTARFGEPGIGQRVFIVTRQQKEGWEGFDCLTSEVVPEKPRNQQASATAASPELVSMHKGCTRDALGTATPPPRDGVAPDGLATPDGEGSAAAVCEPSGTPAEGKPMETGAMAPKEAGRAAVYRERALKEAPSGFGLRPSFGFRPSDFGFAALAYACQIMSATVRPAGMNGSTCSV